jgi:thioredoxin reductase
MIDDWDGSGIYEKWPPVEFIRHKRVAVFVGSTENFEIPEEIVPLSKNFIWFLSDSKTVADNFKGTLIRNPWRVSGINGHNSPESIIIKNEQSFEERSIEIDAVISFVDLQPRQTIYSNFGIEMVGSQVKVDSRMQTSMKRVYAVGDIAHYPGKIMLLSTGIYEARIAVKNVLKII